MSDHLGLAESDADSRWIGVRRHQAVLVIIGLGLLSNWVISPTSPIVEAVGGVALMVCAAPAYDALTIGQLLLIVIRFLLRTHWNTVNVIELGNDLALWAKGDVSFRAYELNHRGRLDLSGRDVTNAESLAALADAASAARAGQHFSEHVLRHRDRTTTMLALPIDVPSPDGWSMNPSLAHEVVGLHDGSTSLPLLERFTYLRASDQLLRLYRVRDFSSVPGSRGLLEQVLRSSTSFDLSLHVAVVSGAKAQRLAARAVHRVGSDDATSRSVGFRRTARSVRSIERLAQRETLVAGGKSLLRVAVYLLVSGSSLDELHQRSSSIWRHAHDAGLRLERGWGLQAQWHRAQLPGGPSW
ncbi:MAG TPA: hypothetical protein VII65_08715 [Acidimicrobiales bacterium]